MVYDFSGQCGSLVPMVAGERVTNWGSFKPWGHWFADLGSINYYDDCFRKTSTYPKNALKTTPEWATEDGVRCLKFDGVGNFVTFPREVLPRGAFTLRFRIKALSPKRQTLLTVRARDEGCLQITIDNGRLRGKYNAEIKKGDPQEWSRQYHLDPNVSVQLGNGPRCSFATTSEISLSPWTASKARRRPATEKPITSASCRHFSADTEMGRSGSRGT